MTLNYWRMRTREAEQVDAARYANGTETVSADTNIVITKLNGHFTDGTGIDDTVSK